MGGHRYGISFQLFNPISHKWPHQALTMTKQVRYQVKYKKRNSTSTSDNVLFCLVYKHTSDNIFGDFLKISNYFPKISKDFPKLFWMQDECFQTFSKDGRRKSEDVSITHQQI